MLEEEEVLLAPISVPTSVPRFYYRFMQPVQLSPSDLDSEYRCQQLYRQVSELSMDGDFSTQP